jgi:hypothetical protein
MKRMNREEFFGKLAALDEERQKKALWNLYWRGNATMRERIEAELDPGPPKQASHPVVDPDAVLVEVRDFASLARAGAYLGGDRRVAPKERSGWRSTFRRLASEAREALAVEDPGPGIAAMGLLIDLACDTRRYDYFRSDDPVEAARFVVSDAVEQVWDRLRRAEGFDRFSARATTQLVRWESRHGWTRRGWARFPSRRPVSPASSPAGSKRPTCGSPSPTITSTHSTRPTGQGISTAISGPETWPSGMACYWTGCPTMTPMTGSTG